MYKKKQAPKENKSGKGLHTVMHMKNLSGKTSIKAI